MKTITTNLALAKRCVLLSLFSALLAGCSGSSSTADNGGGAVTGVATPSKVSVVNTN